MTSATTATWKGGASPWGMTWQKLMMWWFIVTDALLFTGFLASYGFTRGLQGYEWAHFIADGWRPWAAAGAFDRSFAAYFFLITGFHGTHVLIGLIVLAITLLGAINGKVNPNGVEVAGLY